MDSADLQHDLPAAWWMALRYCPYCSGSGTRPGDLEGQITGSDECGFCEGSGDLFGHMLERVYAMGRDEALEAMRALHADFVRAGKLVAENSRPAAQLKARLGV